MGGPQRTDAAAARKVDALRILDAALQAADPRACIRRSIRVEAGSLHLADVQFPLDQIDRLVVIGAGKATPAMASATEQILGDLITSGAISTKYGHDVPLDRIRTTECGHPIPDEAGVEGANLMLEQLSGQTSRSVVLALFSGGGSALMPAPAPGITLGEKQAATSALLNCGATINEINTVRKHLSGTKGGQLAREAQPARLVCLMLSDVIGDQLDAIASGPTYPDSTTFADCIELVTRYEIADILPAAVRSRLEQGAAGAVDETPKAGDPCFATAVTRVIGNNALALSAAETAAQALGYNTLVLSSRIQGEAREVAGVEAAIAQEISREHRPVVPPACLIGGGETTVAIRGRGQGGRNQELALAGAMALSGWDGITLRSAGTDGTDGPTDAAGAVADGDTTARGQQLQMAAADYLDRNDSYNFFKPLGDLILTGPTGTNVIDLQVLLVT